ncbi:uncharacterized protein LOC128163679 [Crassostrea angulata]|uniref:uncharacterized protein LOC128163679 n=1 Tax=Magallana angulata TaxID=2784310 RepID=UPI0022B12E57|nr:uncharacterized protein LOC128163679 [Crassostrea angulata]
MADVAMSELNPNIVSDEQVALVTLSKTTTQQEGPLAAVMFTNHNNVIQQNSQITPSCVSVRLPLNGELFGYDVEIPKGHEIDVNRTVIRPRADIIEITIFKIGAFQLRRLA